MSEYLDLQIHQGVQIVTFARAEKKNAINHAMYRQLVDAIARYGQDDTLHALVITGQGDYFTSGQDLTDWSSLSTGEKPAVIEFLRHLVHCDKPIIAAVNGPAIGIGLTMLLHCDLVYAADTATFQAPFAQLALVPEGGSSLLLPQAIGWSLARDVLFTGRTITADQALSCGLVARVFQPAQLMPSVQDVAVQVAGYDAQAMVETKRLLNHQRSMLWAHMEKEFLAFTAQLLRQGH